MISNKPTDPISLGIEAGLEKAITDAERNQSPLILWRDEKIVEVSAHELRKIRAEQQF